MMPAASWVVGALWAASLVAVGGWAYGAGQDAEVAARGREDKAAARAVEVAATAAAEAISKIKVQHRTVQQEVQREVSERVVYRECEHSPEQLRSINAAITGRAEPAGDRGVP